MATRSRRLGKSGRFGCGATDSWPDIMKIQKPPPKRSSMAGSAPEIWPPWMRRDICISWTERKKSSFAVERTFLPGKWKKFSTRTRAFSRRQSSASRMIIGARLSKPSSFYKKGLKFPRRRSFLTARRNWPATRSPDRLNSWTASPELHWGRSTRESSGSAIGEEPSERSIDWMKTRRGIDVVHWRPQELDFLPPEETRAAYASAWPPEAQIRVQSTGTGYGS